MGSNQIEDVYTLQEVADIFEVSTVSVLQWINQGLLKSTRTSERGDYRMFRSELEAFYSRNGGDTLFKEASGEGDQHI
jgi:excisionase family DNA binding protein